MGRKGGNRGFPSWYRGKLVREDRGGFWYGDREGKLFKQEGKLVDKQMFDSLTDKQREEQIRKIRSRIRRRLK